MKREKFLFEGRLEARVPIKAVCLVTHEAIRYDEQRICLPDGRGFIRVEPFLTREKRWLIDQGFAVGKSIQQVRAIRSVSQLVEYYQKLINGRKLKAEEKKRCREVLLLCGCKSLCE